MRSEITERAVTVAGSPFAAISILAQRSRQIVDGAPPRVATDLSSKPLSTAIRELAAGQIVWR